MTRRRDVLKRVKQRAQASRVSWMLDHERANHSVYKLDGLVIPIPRHNEIDNRLAELIYKQCAAKLGEDWWR